VNNSVATGEDITGEGLVDATWKGGVGATGSVAKSVCSRECDSKGRPIKTKEDISAGSM